MSSRLFHVTGRVQGVGYRYYVVREARALGIAGWVRNLGDGSVEVLAQCEDGLLDTLAGRLWQGPPHARVTAVEASPGETVAWNEFRVLPTPW